MNRFPLAARTLTGFLVTSFSLLLWPFASQAQSVEQELGVNLDNPAFLAEFNGSFETGLMAGAPPMSAREAVVMSGITEMYTQDIDAAIEFALEEIRSEESRITRAQRRRLGGNLEQNYTYSANMEFALGQLYQLNGNRRLAANYFRQAIEKYPAYSAAYHRLMAIALGDEDCVAALELGRKSVEIGGVTGFVFRGMGFCHFTNGNYSSALTAFRMANAIEPGNDSSAYYYGVSAFNSGYYDEAITVLSELVRDYPDRSSYYFLLVNAYLENDESDSALQLLEIARRQGIMTAESYELLGNIYVNKNMPEAAATAYMDGMLEFPQEAEIDKLEVQFSNLTRFNDWELLRSLLDTAEDATGNSLSQSDQLSLAVMRAQVMIGLGEPAMGADILLEVIANNPTNGEALLSLARYYRDQQDFERSAIFYQRAAEEDGVALTALMENAQLASDRRQWQQAISYLEAAQELASPGSSAAITQNLRSLQRVLELSNQ